VPAAATVSIAAIDYLKNRYFLRGRGIYDSLTTTVTEQRW
jgi:hypothetical protein